MADPQMPQGSSSVRRTVKFFPFSLPVIQWLYYGTGTQRFVAATFCLYDLEECKKVLSHKITLLLLFGKKPKTNPNLPSPRFNEIRQRRTLFRFFSGQERLLVGLVWEWN